MKSDGERLGAMSDHQGVAAGGDLGKGPRNAQIAPTRHGAGCIADALSKAGAPQAVSSPTFSRNRWRAVDVRVLRDLWLNASDIEIAKVLRRTPNAIRVKASKIGLERAPKPKIERPTKTKIEKPKRSRWCAWCGDDLPRSARFCNHECYLAYVNDRAQRKAAATAKRPKILVAVQTAPKSERTPLIRRCVACGQKYTNAESKLRQHCSSYCSGRPSFKRMTHDSQKVEQVLALHRLRKIDEIAKAVGLTRGQVSGIIHRNKQSAARGRATAGAAGAKIPAANHPRGQALR